MFEQVKILMDEKKLSATQFSDEIGVQRSSLSHVLSGRNKPSLDFMLKIKSRFPEVSLDWLLLGKGKMVEDSQAVKMAEKVDEEIETENFDTPKKEQILFEEDLKENSEDEKVTQKEVEKELSLKKEVTRNKIDGDAEKIIILYSDKTFSVYNQKS